MKTVRYKRDVGYRLGSTIQFGALLGLLSMIGCVDELETGGYEIPLEGDVIYLSGERGRFSDTLNMSVALISVIGPDRYEFTFCDGFVDYFSQSPCLSAIEVVDGAEDLVGFREFWFPDYNETEECEGVESISISGKVLAGSMADLILHYSLTFDGARADSCRDTYADRIQSVTASGTMEIWSTDSVEEAL